MWTQLQSSRIPPLTEVRGILRRELEATEVFPECEDVCSDGVITTFADYFSSGAVEHLVQSLKKNKIPFELTECDSDGKDVRENIYRPATANDPGGYWVITVRDGEGYVCIDELRKLLENPETALSEIQVLCEKRDPRPNIISLKECRLCYWFDNECGDCPGTINEWGPAGVGCCVKFSKDEDFEELERGCPECKKGVLSPRMFGYSCNKCWYSEPLWK